MFKQFALCENPKVKKKKHQKQMFFILKSNNWPGVDWEERGRLWEKKFLKLNRANDDRNKKENSLNNTRTDVKYNIYSSSAVKHNYNKYIIYIYMYIHISVYSNECNIRPQWVHSLQTRKYICSLQIYSLLTE